MNRIFTVTADHPGAVAVSDTDRAIGLDGQPAGVAVLINQDQVNSRAQMQRLFDIAKAAVLADLEAE